MYLGGAWWLVTAAWSRRFVGFEAEYFLLREYAILEIMSLPAWSRLAFARFSEHFLESRILPAIAAVI